MLVNNFPIKLRASLGFQNLSLEDFKKYEIGSSFSLPDFGIISVCIDNLIIAKAEVIIVNGEFGLQIFETVKEKIKQDKAVLIEFIFGEFFINDIDFEKGQVISLQKKIEENNVFFLVNGVKNDDIFGEIKVKHNLMYNPFFNFEVKEVGKYEQKEHGLEFMSFEFDDLNSYIEKVRESLNK